MRQIEFPPKTQHQRRDRDIAVAWVTSQHPGQVIEDGNVTSAIHKELRAHGFTVSQQEIKHSIDSLVKEGWAESLTIGRRTRMFMIKDDVEVPEPVFVKAKARVTGKVVDEEKIKKGDEKIIHVGGPLPMPPLPGQPLVSPYRLDELTKRLETWHQSEPEVYSSWVDAAIESLEANT